MTLARPHQVGLGVVGRETTQLRPQEFIRQDTGGGGGQGRNQ